jgi:hypothetical protein
MGCVRIEVVCPSFSLWAWAIIRMYYYALLSMRRPSSLCVFLAAASWCDGKKMYFGCGAYKRIHTGQPLLEALFDKVRLPEASFTLSVAVPLFCFSKCS